ncbi:hypothetical protein EVAR_70384_1 [Eumeta japonica]|uniref:Uncharacterized protein n=1 Tax=Eumeta variegata TaxID=151549 RepID=A0A4C2A505_EUMVA|nr:hypothetical protein EVAR_70384_1 [Eumeta japonica]
MNINVAAPAAHHTLARMKWHTERAKTTVRWQYSSKMSPACSDLKSASTALHTLLVGFVIATDFRSLKFHCWTSIYAPRFSPSTLLGVLRLTTACDPDRVFGAPGRRPSLAACPVPGNWEVATGCHSRISLLQAVIGSTSDESCPLPLGLPDPVNYVGHTSSSKNFLVSEFI